MRRFVVVGAGAIGGVVGALLARAGVEVLLVARGEHGETMRRDGLLLQRPDDAEVVRVAVELGGPQAVASAAQCRSATSGCSNPRFIGLVRACSGRRRTPIS